MSAWLAFALGPAIATALLIAAARRSPLAARLADVPNERSLHVRPTPRLGGICLVTAALPAAALAAGGTLGAILACAAALSALSLVDDARGLPIEVRLPAHAVASLVAVLAVGAGAGWGWLAAAGVVLAIVWMTNLFNFMDGADGLAGGMAAIGFAALAAGFARAGEAQAALAAVAVAGAAAGFLAFNFPPARVFLGDAGSVPLGFLAGALGALGWARGAWPAWFPVLVFAPFVVDATLTLARRVAAREPFWRAHRTHFYQRLALSGFAPRALALSAYALMLAAAGAALWALGQDERGRYAILSAWSAVHLSILAAIARRAGKPRSRRP